MMKILALGILMIASSQAAPSVEQLADERLRALPRNDDSFVARHYADDYTTTSVAGASRTRSEVAAGFRSGDVKYESMSQEDRKVRVYGDTAIVTGIDILKGRDRGQDVSGRRRFTRVWVKQGGQWRLAANHATRI